MEGDGTCRCRRGIDERSLMALEWPWDRLVRAVEKALEDGRVLLTAPQKHHAEGRATGTVTALGCNPNNGHPRDKRLAIQHGLHQGAVADAQRTLASDEGAGQAEIEHLDVD